MEHFYKTISGHFTFPSFYSWLVSQLPNNSHGVEVGVLRGQSSAYLGVEMINSGRTHKLDLVDVCPVSDYYPNLEPIHSIIGKCISAPSVQAASEYKDKSLDWVFIDGAHEYESVKADIEAWLPKVKQGGAIAGHDFNHEYQGIVQAVTESFEKWHVMRCDHWEGSSPENAHLYFPVWYVWI